jgi:hypothetical protein
VVAVSKIDISHLRPSDVIMCAFPTAGRTATVRTPCRGEPQLPSDLVVVNHSDRASPER